MTQRPDVDQAPQRKDDMRKTWVKPAVQKIVAGEAEVFTRSANDGSFTTS